MMSSQTAPVLCAVGRLTLPRGKHDVPGSQVEGYAMEQRFQVSGMSCGHCVRAVTEAVQEVDPGAAVQVDLAQHAVVVHSSAERARLGAAIADAGYEVEGAAV